MVRWTCPSCKDDTTYEVSPGVSKCICGRQFITPSNGGSSSNYSGVRMTCPGCRDDTTMHVTANIWQCTGCGTQFHV